MTTRKLFVVAIVWVVSLLGVALWAQGGGGADVRPVPSQQAPMVSGTDAPLVTGNDIGFQPIGTSGHGEITGRLMVRIDGKWLVAASAVTIVPAEAR